MKSNLSHWLDFLIIGNKILNTIEQSKDWQVIFSLQKLQIKESRLFLIKKVQKNIEINDYKKNSLGVDKEKLTDGDYQEPLSEKFKNTSKLGFLETGFINFLLQAKGDLVVLKGYRGTGKSELIRFVSNYMVENTKHETCTHYDKCKKRKVTHLIINFNEGQFSTSKAFINDLQVRIFHELGAAMAELFDDSRNNNENILDEFINKCEKDNIAYWFNIKERLINGRPDWVEKNDREKYRILFTNIQERYETITNGMNAILS